MFKVTKSAVAEHACEQKFRKIFGHRHHGCKRMRWRTANEYAYLERAPFFNRFLMMPCNVTLDLVMQSAFFVRNVIVTGNLNAIHPDVRLHDAGAFAWTCGDLRERDERSAV